MFSGSFWPAFLSPCSSLLHLTYMVLLLLAWAPPSSSLASPSSSSFALQGKLSSSAQVHHCISSHHLAPCLTCMKCDANYKWASLRLAIGLATLAALLSSLFIQLQVMSVSVTS